jgi:glycine cleavage system regulatory protein
MKTHALLSALGRDRIGVADDLAEALSARKIDIEHSRMTALHGQCALIVQVHGDKSHVSSLQDDLAAIGAGLGFHLQLEPIAEERAAQGPPQLTLEAHSRGPSGFNAVTAILKKRGVNIEDLETDAYSSAWTSAITFQMRALLTIPPTCSVDSLMKELHDLERGRKLEIVLKPVAETGTEPVVSAKGH